MNQPTGKLFKLYGQNGTHILTCDLKGLANVIPGFAILAELDDLSIGGTTNFYSLQGDKFLWERVQ